MRITFWGTRGSVATPGAGTVRYGGNTSCVEVATDEGTLVILDCGTGARLLGEHLMETCSEPIQGHILVTHTHWDHIQGFPFFAPAFEQENDFTIYGPADGSNHLEQALSGQMKYMYFPVELEDIEASLYCHNLQEGTFVLSDDVTVTSQYMNHPAVTLGYRLEVGAVRIVYATDHEPFSPVLFGDGAKPSWDALIHSGDRRHADFLAGADLVVHDAQYTSAEYEGKRGWGHGTVDYATELCLLAGAKRLALFHHDPSHDDSELEEMVRRAQAIVRERGGTLDVFIAAEGQSLSLQEQPRAVISQ